ncbi:alkaline phosphatase D family protein [Roseinatronobacter sp. NSM]|uniref:alkaline phosphatase D family protein n=1 Tax=Roseinatronobacter sp. NSM TaxID=3457785 RepID=UPI0040372286
MTESRQDKAAQPRPFGPILLFRKIRTGYLHLAAVFGYHAASPRPVLDCDTGEGAYSELLRLDGYVVGRIDFALRCAASPAHYVFNGQKFDVQTQFDGDLRMAFASCNGQEHGDFDRPESRRNAMWRRLHDEHMQHPFALLLHGGDQIYADEDVKSHPLTKGWPDDLPSEVTAAEMRDLERTLRRAFIARYTRLFASRAFAEICCQIPSLAMWDDHDICDGWGSLERSRTRSAIGQTMFAVAREMFLVFQHGATEGDIPKLFSDPSGEALGWHHRFPDFQIIAPDLRSERGRRQVMGARGWAMMDVLRTDPVAKHVFLLSSVPLLGPRLSIVERIMMLIPSMQKYEDDLRDQWQSRAHRAEWQRMLSLCLDVLEHAGMTVLSGEIHLATQARMKGRGRDLVQLIASGIAHDAPPHGYARALGVLAGLGEAPLPDHPITISPLPGQVQRYVAERNYLVLQRHSGQWSAEWELEHTGRTPPVSL